MIFQVLNYVKNFIIIWNSDIFGYSLSLIENPLNGFFSPCAKKAGPTFRRYGMPLLCLYLFRSPSLPEAQSAVIH